MKQVLDNKSVLLIISGGIAAYKSLELIRLLRGQGAQMRCILTAGGAQFVTPLSVAALSEQPVYGELFSLKDETEMGHIKLSREADLIIIAPASANIIAKMAHGIADDLATTALLAADKPVMIAPAMNGMMWDHPATRDNTALLHRRGVLQIGPDDGAMACGETGTGRMAEPAAILAAITDFFSAGKPLAGQRALVTSGPTYEALDPVRFLGNRSSGKQGHAIAAALAELGAAVTLVSGPVALPDPAGVKTIHVESARQMLAACQAALPASIAVCAAAVSDWAPQEVACGKIKKAAGTAPPTLALKENPDILASLAAPGSQRPSLVIGFAAETGDLLAQATQKRARKGCDWLLANDVSGTGAENVFGADENHVYLLTAAQVSEWPERRKQEIAARLADEIAAYFSTGSEVAEPFAAE